jgi:hypothetical protein
MEVLLAGDQVLDPSGWPLDVPALLEDFLLAVDSQFDLLQDDSHHEFMVFGLTVDRYRLIHLLICALRLSRCDRARICLYASIIAEHPNMLTLFAFLEDSMKNGYVDELASPFFSRRHLAPTSRADISRRHGPR